ncbi:alpha/beta hydrolase [Duganella sp. Leaf126]|nr:alpha/beta hydrolase [Duganella sp. Leaf126]
MSSKAQWAALTAQLADTYRCLPLDLLGYGAAPFPAGAGAGSGYVHTLAHEAEAIKAALATTLAPDEPFHLVGHSYGGVSALHLARSMPDRVLSLALHEPVAFHLLPDDDPSKMEITGVVGTILGAGSDRDATRTFIDYWNRPGAFDAAPPAAQDKMIAMIAKVRLDFEALLGEPVSFADLAALTVPTLVMAGQHSPISTRGLAPKLAAALPNATMLETCGAHMGPITHADAINPVIAEFLGRH